MKKILVTGSHGYIGTLVCPELEKFGYSVQGIDNGYFLDCLINGSDRDLPFIKKHLNKIIIDDIKRIDVVIHLAGLQNDPLKNTLPGKVYDIEHEYTKKLAKICEELNIQFIYASSCSVYGAGTDKFLNEESKVNPLTPYSKNKLRTEEYLLSISNKSFNPIMLRFATVYGYSPRMRFDLYINQFVGMALTQMKIQLNSDGLAWRPNLHISDIPNILDSVISQQFLNPTIINIGNPDSNMQVVNVIKAIQSIKPNIITSMLKPDERKLYEDQYVINSKDSRSYRIDFSKMENLLGIDICPTNIEAGIEMLIKQLENIEGLNSKIKDPRFFRLQWTQELISIKKIDEKFQWSN